MSGWIALLGQNYPTSIGNVLKNSNTSKKTYFKSWMKRKKKEIRKTFTNTTR